MAKTVTLMLILGLMATGIGACGESRSLLSPPAVDSLAAVGTSPNTPPPPPVGSFLGQLSPAQTQQLLNLGVDVVVPGAVPPEFSVAQLAIQPDRSGTPAYTILYRNRASQCFAIEFMSTSGVASLTAEHRIPIHPPLFGAGNYGLNYGHIQDRPVKTQMPDSALFTDWLLGRSGAYRLVGASYISQNFPAMSGCQDVAPEQAVALVESLTVLAPDIMGDGEALK